MTRNTAIQKKPGEEGAISRVERRPQRWSYVPRCDILETPEELLVLADMPGVAPEGLEVEYERGVLTLHGHVENHRDEEQAGYILREYGVGDYYRSFRVPDTIDTHKITAELRNGVMRLHLPKVETCKPRKIQVKST